MVTQKYERRLSGAWIWQGHPLDGASVAHLRSLPNFEKHLFLLLTVINFYIVVYASNTTIAQRWEKFTVLTLDVLN